MKKLLFTGLLFAVFTIPGLAQAGAPGLELPAPADGTLVQEVDLDPARLMEIIRSGNSKLEQFIREIRRCRLVSYRMNKPTTLSDMIRFYESPLQMQGWKMVIRDEKAGKASAIFERPSGGLLILGVEKTEFAIIRVEGVFDFTSARSSSGVPPTPNIASAIQGFRVEEVPLGNPEWSEDTSKKTVTGERSYRQVTIPVTPSGRIVFEGFNEDPQVTQWNRNEVTLDYRKIFTGSDKNRALDMERRCPLVVDVTPGRVQVRQGYVAPATPGDCRNSLKVVIPNAWKTEVLRKGSSN